jgi:NAD(P)-dependent dehydrogenase (short-subunit alcohol dehydrogenase family)
LRPCDTDSIAGAKIMPEQPVVIVTDASRGMGREIVRWLAAAKASVVPAARSASALDTLSEEVENLGARALPIPLDVTDRLRCVDTDMQAATRREGPAAMTPEWIDYFQKLKEEKRLLPPEVPAREAAWLALHAPAHWSGEWIETGDARIEEAAKQVFPDNLL